MACTLHATPGQKCPWLLSDGVGAAQETGVRDTVAAQDMAELWFEFTGLVGAAGRAETVARAHMTMPHPRVCVPRVRAAGANTGGRRRTGARHIR